MITSKIIRFFSTAALVVGFSTVVHAQASRTWVSGVGDDVNPCSRTAPCKTFAGAISKTLAGGEINVLDPGGFGAVTITKSISIISQFEAGIVVQGTPGITVNGANAKVLLDGLEFEGLNNSPSTQGTIGIRILNAATVTIRKCSIRNFSQQGISLTGPANTRVYLQDSQIINNTGGGFFLQGTSGAANNAVIERTTFDLNTGTAVNIVGPANVVLSGNTMAFSATSVQSSAGAVVVSYSDNVFRGTSAGVTSTITKQ